MIDPQAAVANLERLAEIGAQGRYGFYEALDYTPARVPEGETVAIVHAFMAHHQGMTIVAIADALLDGAMRTRFHAEPIDQGDRTASAGAHAARRRGDASLGGGREVGRRRSQRRAVRRSALRFARNSRRPPRTCCRTAAMPTMLTAAGSGYSRWGDMALTRWREDATCDDSGFYIYVRDLRTRRRLVGGISAERRRTGRLSRRLRRRPRRDHAQRRLADDDVGHPRLRRGRRGSSPGLDHQFRKPPARHRDHLLRRTRARAPERRRRASGLLEAVRRDGISARTSERSLPRAESGRRAIPTSGRRI